METTGKMLPYLHSLVHKLDKNEKKCLKQYLTCFDPNFSEEHEVKTLKLFEILDAAPNNHSFASILKNIYPDECHKKFAFLALRLISKIHESLLLDVNTERHGTYSNQSKASIEVRKKLILAQILWSRDLTGWLGHLLQSIIRKTQQFELYADLQEALYLKQQFEGLTGGLDAYNKVNADIEKCNQQQVAVRKAKHYYTLLTLGGFEPDASKPDALTLEAALKETETLFIQYPSRTLNFYLHMIRLGHCQVTSDFATGSTHCLNLIELLRQSEDLFHNRHLGIAYAQLADNELYTGQFRNALKYSVEARKHIAATSPNAAMLSEVEFYAYLYLGMYDEAALVFSSPATAPRKGIELPMRIQRQSFLHANILFLFKRFGEAHTHLSRASALLKDKKGWNVGYRIFEIMVLMEQNKLDRIELLTDSLRKHLSRFPATDNCGRRNELILKLIQRIIRNNYNFKLTLEKSKDVLAQLAAPKGELCWEVKTPEVIPFDRWVVGKAQAELVSGKRVVGIV
jgi:hypothetical protein